MTEQQEREAFFDYVAGNIPRTDSMIARIIEYNIDAWRAWKARGVLAAPAVANECWCDKRGLGVKGVSCGDCPRDYAKPVSLMDEGGKLLAATGEPVAVVCDFESSTDDDGQVIRYALVYIDSAVRDGTKLYAAPQPPAVASGAGWLPIESVPKDWNSRLFRVNDFCVQGFVDATGVLCAQNDRQPWRKMHGKPTHWMAIPAAPGA